MERSAHKLLCELTFPPTDFDGLQGVLRVAEPGTKKPAAAGFLVVPLGLEPRLF